jgi:hypothetical protein
VQPGGGQAEVAGLVEPPPAPPDRPIPFTVRADDEASQLPAPLSPAYRILAAPAICDLAVRLAVPLFVGRPDPALARPASYPPSGLDR